MLTPLALCLSVPPPPDLPHLDRIGSIGFGLMFAGFWCLQLTHRFIYRPCFPASTKPPRLILAAPFALVYLGAVAVALSPASRPLLAFASIFLIPVIVWPLQRWRQKRKHLLNDEPFPPREGYEE